MIEMRMKVNKVKFGKFIAERRVKLYGPLSQLLLAEKLHIAGPTLTNIENGSRGLSFDLFIDLADALLMTPGELMMVLAERADEHARYGEMNSWLYERLIRIVDEYQALITPPPQEPPQLTSGQAQGERRKIDLDKGRGAARNTPDVVPPVENGPEADPDLDQEPTSPNPTNNIQ